MPTLMKWLVNRAKKISGLLKGGSPQEEARNLLVSNPEDLRALRLEERNVWYTGDSDKILNFYTKNTAMDFNYEPWYFKNKRSYFWSMSASESDIKRTHSGIPQSIVDTMSSIMGRPTAHVGATPAYKSVYHEQDKNESALPISSSSPSDDRETAILNHILDECFFWDDIYETQKKKTLYQGWGAYKISWDTSISDLPFISYYSAENVDFVYRAGRIIGIIFRDWYGEGTSSLEPKVLVTEVRTIERVSSNGSEASSTPTMRVRIEKKAWKQMPVSNNDAQLTELSGDEVPPELRDSLGTVVIDNFSDLLAQPTVFFNDASMDGDPGRSIFEGRIDKFDDLDQELSQKANCVGKSTPVEYFNTDFLERDSRTGLPIMPKRYDRKYTSYQGGRGSDGSPMSGDPVQVTQPNIDFGRYSAAAVETLKFILHGLLSPATMGIDVSVQASQQSQREKEKITISTRNHLIDRSASQLRKLFSGLLCAYEYLHSDTHTITKDHYDISIRFDQFADSSFEEKLMSLGEALDNGNISPEMYLDKLYGDTLSKGDYEKELQYLKTAHDPMVQAQMQQQLMAQQEEPLDEEEPE